MEQYFVLLLVSALLLAVALWQGINAGHLRRLLAKREDEVKSLEKGLSRVRADLEEARLAARSVASQQVAKKRDSKRPPPEREREREKEVPAHDPAELERLRGDLKRAKEQIETLSGEIEGRKESIRDAQAALSRLREEGEARVKREKDLEQAREAAKAKADSAVARAEERAAERERERGSAPPVDLERELRKERAKVEEKYAEKIARLEERLARREEKEKSQDERRGVAERDHIQRLEKRVKDSKEFIRKKGVELATAHQRLEALGKAYSVLKSELALARDQIAYLKNEVPAYTPESEREVRAEEGGSAAPRDRQPPRGPRGERGERGPRRNRRREGRPPRSEKPTATEASPKAPPQDPGGGAPATLKAEPVIEASPEASPQDAPPRVASQGEGAPPPQPLTVSAPQGVPPSTQEPPKEAPLMALAPIPDRIEVQSAPPSLSVAPSDEKTKE